MCLFYPLMYQDLPLVEMINAVTGWNLTFDDALKIGNRIHTLRHCFNLREGLLPKDFQLPPRAAGVPPLTAGSIKGITVDVNTLTKNFYLEKGWDPISGIPSEEALQELDLKELVGDMVAVK